MMRLWAVVGSHSTTDDGLPPGAPSSSMARLVALLRGEGPEFLGAPLLSQVEDLEEARTGDCEAPSGGGLLGHMRRGLGLGDEADADYGRLRLDCRSWYVNSTDVGFVRSEVNGRQSRRVVLLAFFCTEVCGAVMWAHWCREHPAEEMELHHRHSGFPQPTPAAMLGGSATGTGKDVCYSFGLDQYVLLAAALPAEGLVLFLAGWKPWSFWSDSLLLPIWLLRLVFFDLVVWKSPPYMLVGDMLWYFVLAVMCRVHSLALVVLVVSMLASLYAALAMRGDLDHGTFDVNRYGHYSAALLIIVAVAYILDEHSRLRSFSQLMRLQDTNSELAERFLRWKVLTGPLALGGDGSNKAAAITPRAGGGGMVVSEEGFTLHYASSVGSSEELRRPRAVQDAADGGTWGARGFCYFPAVSSPHLQRSRAMEPNALTIGATGLPLRYDPGGGALGSIGLRPVGEAPALDIMDVLE